MARLSAVARSPEETGLPMATLDLSPVEYADELGRWYGLQIDDEHRKRHGHYLTPMSVALFMGTLALGRPKKRVRVLDPAAGAGMLAAAVCQSLALVPRPPAVIELVLYEIDPGLVPVVEACTAHLHQWLARRGIALNSQLHVRDFVLANAGALEPSLFPHDDPFDAVICNPPYFKLQKSDPRAQACLQVVHGQPNLYGLFMALGAAVLRKGGRLAFITPRSYASGPYFQRFRDWFFARMGITDLHVFESRSDAFEAVLQETVITAGTRRDSFLNRKVKLSISEGSKDIDERRTRSMRLRDIVHAGEGAQHVLHLPTEVDDDRVRAIVNGWSGSLHVHGFEVSTGPVIAFRAKRFLRHAAGASTVPLLWLQHVKSMAISWPLETRKPEHMEDNAASARLTLPNRNYVLLRRFTAKEEARRLVAAPYVGESSNAARIGFENHLNYIHRPRGSMDRDEAYGLAAILNSELMDSYVRISSGNTQVSATELRALPLPALTVIKRIGRRARSEEASIETIVAQELTHAA